MKLAIGRKWSGSSTTGGPEGARRSVLGAPGSTSIGRGSHHRLAEPSGVRAVWQGRARALREPRRAVVYRRDRCVHAAAPKGLPFLGNPPPSVSTHPTREGWFDARDEWSRNSARRHHLQRSPLRGDANAL